jgi:hypothetical protein
MLGKYWKFEDIPLYNWIKCTQGNFEFVLKEQIEVDLKECEQQFNLIFDEYIQNNGLSNTYLRLLKLVKKKALLEVDYVISQDRFLLTKIEVCEQDIDTFKKSQDRGISIQETLVILSKYMGYRLDWKVITKSEYDMILKRYSNDNKTENNG